MRFIGEYNAKQAMWMGSMSWVKQPKEAGVFRNLHFEDDSERAQRQCKKNGLRPNPHLDFVHFA